MKHLDGNYYFEVKDHRYSIHPTEKFMLRLRDESKSLETQYQVQNDTQIRKNKKVIKTDNIELIVKNYPKNKQSIVQKQKPKPPKCPSSKQNIWLGFDKGYYCRNCEYVIKKEKHQIDKKVLGQDRDFSNRINYAYKKIREIRMNLINTTKKTEDMIKNLQSFKSKTKITFYKRVSNFYDNMNIGMDKDPFAKNAQGISKTYHEVLLSMKFLQIEPHVMNMNVNYYDSYSFVIKNKDEKEIVDNQYENDYTNFNDIFPNHFTRQKSDNEMLGEKFRILNESFPTFHPILIETQKR